MACSSAPLPFVLDRATAFGMLLESGVQRLTPGQPEPDEADLAARLRTLPLHPQEIVTHYEGIPKLKGQGLQRAFSADPQPPPPHLPSERRLHQL